MLDLLYVLDTVYDVTFKFLCYGYERCQNRTNRTSKSMRAVASHVKVMSVECRKLMTPMCLDVAEPG